MNNKIGFTVGGTYSKGVLVKLEETSHEEIEIGHSLIAKGKQRKYLMITNDVIADSDAAASTVNMSRKPMFAKDMITDTLLTSKINCIPIASSTSKEVEDARTIPDYLSECYLLTPEEAWSFYGACDMEIRYPLGTIKPLDFKVPIDLDTLIQNSFGIFGKSGTGKSVLGNLIAAYIVLYSNHIKNTKLASIPSVLLIFDMHSEYGLKLKTPTQQVLAPGIAETFPEEFRVYCVDPELVDEIDKEFRRGTLASELKIQKKNIEVEDIVVLSELLNISGIGALNLYAVKNRLEELDKTWFDALLNFDNFDYNVLKSKFDMQVITSLRAFSRRLEPFKHFSQITDENDTCQELINDLKENKNVVVTFGRYGDSEILYMFVVNYISRRLRDEYVSKGIMEGTKNRIIIFVEEAHKFLNPQVRGSSPLGLIARELRKRGIVLCVIDQTPSQIDENVFGMVWNFFIGATSIDRDVEVSTRTLKLPELFKPLVTSLRKQEFLAYGSAIKFPAVVKVMEYRSQMAELRRIYESKYKPDLSEYSKSLTKALNSD